jgi:hypothetical protein
VRSIKENFVGSEEFGYPLGFEFGLRGNPSRGDPGSRRKDNWKCSNTVT